MVDENYHQKYWDEHKKEINRRRRLKYRQSTVEQEAAKERFKKSYRKRRRDQIIQELNEREIEKKSGHEVVNADGKVIQLYSINTFAKYVSVSTNTIRNWLRDDLIPRPTAIIGNRQLFSSEYMNMVRQAMVALGTKRLADKAFETKLKNVFSELYAFIKATEDSIYNQVMT